MNRPISELHCETCGKVLDPGAIVCEYCGSPVGSNGRNESARPAAAAGKKSNSLLLPIAVFAGVFGVCVCLVLVFAVFLSNNSSGKLASDLAPSPTSAQAPALPTAAAPPATQAPGIPTAAAPPATQAPALPTVAEPPAALPAPTFSAGFSDDFSDPASGWPVEDTADASFQYVTPPGYQIIVKQPDSWVYAIQKPIFDNVVIAVRGQLVPQPGAYLGVVCRHADKQNYYAVSLAADSYNIGKQINGKWVNLTEPAWQKYVTPLELANGMLSIEFSCIDDRLGLVVDGIGQPLVTDSDFTQGRVGLLAGARKDAVAVLQEGYYAIVEFFDFSATRSNP